jgi:hypothetical protein
MALPLALAAVGAGAKVVGMIDSYSQQKKAERELAKLSAEKRKRYEVTPEIRAGYEQAMGDASTRRGYGGATLSNFRRKLGQTLSAKGRMANNISGGSSARGVNAVLAGQETAALGDFYAGEEAFANQNRERAIGRKGQYENLYQRIADENTQQDINYRNMLEQAYGSSIRSQRDYRLGSLSSLGTDLITAGVMKYNPDGGDAEKVVTETNPLSGRNYSSLPPSITDLRANGNYYYRNNPTMDRLNNPRNYAPQGFGQSEMTRPFAENMKKRGYKI